MFCGHYHANAGGFYREDLEVVVTTAVGCQINSGVSHGMRIVRVDRDSVTHHFHTLDEFPGKVELTEKEPEPGTAESEQETAKP